MNYSRFTPADLKLAEAWSSRAESPCNWELGDKLMGESGPNEALNPDGLKAVAKPSVAHNDGVPRAAHEKIAADLAHHVGVPVPSVVLWTNQKSGKDYAISRWAFPECETWIAADRLGLYGPADRACSLHKRVRLRQPSACGFRR